MALFVSRDPLLPDRRLPRGPTSLVLVLTFVLSRDGAAERRRNVPTCWRGWGTVAGVLFADAIFGHLGRRRLRISFGVVTAGGDREAWPSAGGYVSGLGAPRTGPSQSIRRAWLNFSMEAYDSHRRARNRLRRVPPRPWVGRPHRGDRPADDDLDWFDALAPSSPPLPRLPVDFAADPRPVEAALHGRRSSEPRGASQCTTPRRQRQAARDLR